MEIVNGTVELTKKEYEVYQEVSKDTNFISPLTAIKFLKQVKGLENINLMKDDQPLKITKALTLVSEGKFTIIE